ncbi:hypothetical protein [Paramaledivibacter caminithermalis]|uniref:Uncharacterized protein n=1 Tax=Paramaledivibacter caminithermalis (strain DSM 15212 / CIP 107654 / DViRD3) TaxID=1121301 RepID=A0A1M6QH99_PARC5|nr:hypothetical protein [Paramaledivibacter caminithermalis]SHK19443.1 hypothetical protein SAMN02745912_02575 [Paramaledivibacter caminithermalis DSM 15212]
MMSKKLICTLTVIMLVFNTMTIAFADTGYPTAKNAISIPYTENNVKKYEVKTPEDVKREIEITPYGVDPGEGALRVKETSGWTSGTVYDGDEESSSVLSTILSIGLSAAGYFIGTVQNIVKDVALIVFGLDWQEVIISSLGSAKAMHSYAYISKLGQVYTNYSWRSKVDIEKREWYGHSFASFKGSDGKTHTGSVDYLDDTLRVDKKDHYDDNWIMDKTNEIYKWNLDDYVDAYTHTTIQ